jgi:hypothetical protein
MLHLVSAVRWLEMGWLLTPGLALREEPGLSPMVVPEEWKLMLTAPLARGATPASLEVSARPKGLYHPYTFSAELAPDAVTVREATPGRRGLRSLLVPFVRDAGGGFTTRWQTEPGALRLSMGAEELLVEWNEPAERVLVLTGGLESRRGLCALARIDLVDAGEDLKYTVRKIK